MISTALIWVVIAFGVVALASWVHYVRQVRRLTVDLPYELVERLPTADGSAIELRRLPRERSTLGPPVLLVHGLALNHRNNDLMEDLSLGRFLAKEGRDVWLLTLRCGRDDLSWGEERRATFATMSHNDLPLGIEAVLEKTGARELDYVGFSMGGMLMYVAAGRTVDADKLRRVVIIGSPATIESPLAVLSVVARFVPSWIVPTLRLRMVSSFLAFAAEVVQTPIHRWVYNHENVEPGRAAYVLVNGFVNIPSGLAAELVRFASDGGVVRIDGEPVVDSLRSLVDVPALFIAGAADQLAPVAAVKMAHDAWGADGDAHKDFRIVGIDFGAAADYGHGDLAIGRFADQDVFAPVLSFLAAERLEIRERPDDEVS